MIFAQHTLLASMHSSQGAQGILEYSTGQLAECTEYRWDAESTSNLARSRILTGLATAIPTGDY
ncbi:MAG: hypothetical protein AAFZ49_02645 [Cyanobacteria bacterium J06659_2]